MEMAEPLANGNAHPITMAETVHTSKEEEAAAASGDALLTAPPTTETKTNDTTTNPEPNPSPCVSPPEPQGESIPGLQQETGIPTLTPTFTPTSNASQKRKRRRREVVDAAAGALAASSIRALRQGARGSAIYDEAQMDRFLQRQLGDDPGRPGGPGRKKKIPDMAKEVETEAMIAYSVGFPPDSLTEEEIEAGVVPSIGGTEQANYIVVRNHILARWRDNVHTWLHQDRAMESIRSEHKALVNSAYNFLHQHGYINFGVAPAVKEVAAATVAAGANVVVVGAGLAGLAAARQLLALGFKVVVVEGRRRPGGRVFTRRMEGGLGTGRMVGAADLGGSVITGIHGNPLAVLARQLGFPLHKVRDECPLYEPSGRPVDKVVDMTVEEAFNRLLDKACHLRQAMDEVTVDISLGTALETFRKVYGVAEVEEERRLLDWHLANLEYANAALLSKLSLAFWDQDDPYEMAGDHCFLPGGNARIVQALAEGLPIFYDKTVQAVRYGSDGVQVVAGGQIFQADMVLCTVPLGVLKSGSIKFEPELPQRKLEAIRRLGFGLLNKVVMLFPTAFWGPEIDTFGHLCEDTSRRGEFFLFYSYASVSGGPLLIALVAGEAAIKFESTPPTESVEKVLKILRGIYGPWGLEVPDPIQTVCTRWGSDPFSLGSYSHVAVGASGDDYDILAESVGEGRVFFAGEATNRRYPASMHGAFLSGLREAANIFKVASTRAMTERVVDRCLSRDNDSYGTLLTDLFREPDLAFGGFSVLFDPQSIDLNSMSLLRIVVGGNRRQTEANGVHSGQEQQSNNVNQIQMASKQPSHQLQLYSLVTRQQAVELSQTDGGDEDRLKYLCEKLGARLVGRRGIDALGDALVSSVKFVRSSQNDVLATPVQFNFGNKGTQV
uniref:SWIRM domain-containing protein n=1 Tax=Araucaria cunninghamii TaxID=56994 RepID=A0A0D6QZQ4_ARACU